MIYGLRLMFAVRFEWVQVGRPKEKTVRTFRACWLPNPQTKFLQRNVVCFKWKNEKLFWDGVFLGGGKEDFLADEDRLDKNCGYTRV